ncbi:MAG TPA: hypothetical protein VGM90_13965 [Kofleriaceae bacterium]|jgi:hypothetical protein
MAKGTCVMAMVAATVGACTTGATVQLELANQTPIASARTTGGAQLLSDGTELQLKILSVYLAEDVDPATMNNIGNNAMIWIAPECNGVVDTCNVAGLAQPPGPRVTTYFDLARPTAEVNAQLAAQVLPIDAGSYRYARIEMCKVVGAETQPTIPTMLWAGPGIAEQSFTSGDCGRTSLPFDPPLAIAGGDTIAVTLGYDLGRAIVSGAPAPDSRFGIAGELDASGSTHAFRSCADASASQRVCMDFPDFAPSASVQ